jgi:hypothetical protein|tara:strand:+ start:365 stop:1627 length:1263 start_codon:yes stop_codon:yes gene_type:complete
MQNITYQPPKASWIMKLFWKAAGGDSYILKQATYSDQVKYFCLGGIVVATAIMAGLSGGYAFYTIFKPSYGDVLDGYVLANGSANGFVEPTYIETALISLLFGLVWGLIIYNIDRFIVTSTGKGDGTEAITWGELKGSLPRIIMGCIIAISISKPLEIRILKGEIDTRLQIKQEQLKDEQTVNIENKYSNRILEKNEKIAEYQKPIDKAEVAYSNAVAAFDSELAERPGGTSSGYGPDAKAKEAVMNTMNGKLISITKSMAPLIADLNNDISKYVDDKNTEISNIDKSVSGLDGLAERITLAEEHYPAVSWFLTLLFLAIELTPIFFKLMLIKSPYDYLSENYKQIELAENGIWIDEDYYEEKEGIQRELVRYLAAEKQIEEQREFHDAQLRITKHAIAKFEEKEKKKIDENPEDYISYS